jgi:hypothetical protein
VKRGIAARPGQPPQRNGDVNVDQLKQLVQIQTQIVKLAEQNERAKRNHKSVLKKLEAAPRRLRRFIPRLW